MFWKFLAYVSLTPTPACVFLVPLFSFAGNRSESRASGVTPQLGFRISQARSTVNRWFVKTDSSGESCVYFHALFDKWSRASLQLSQSTNKISSSLVHMCIKMLWNAKKDQVCKSIQSTLTKSQYLHIQVQTIVTFHYSTFLNGYFCVQFSLTSSLTPLYQSRSD